MKRVLLTIALILIMISIILVGCNKEQAIDESISIGEVEQPEVIEESDTTEDIEIKDDSDELSVEERMELPLEQFRIPKSGDIIAHMMTNYGEINILLFPEIAPKTVENFVKLSEEGYYDNLIFHRVINDFMIQGGDPTGTGMGGESIWDTSFEDEFDLFYFPYNGALCMANSGPNTNGSQFFIVQLSEYDEETYNGMISGGFPGSMTDVYKAKGGTPHLFLVHTVFGQVQMGMDVVDTIAAVKVEDSRPVESVIIESIKIEYVK